MSLETGSRIFDYEILGVLGAGGMGKVYKVRNVISDRIDAMKVLLPDLAHQPDLADRFLREIKVLASLNHPNIAAFHTALRFENQLIMVMELVNGTTLSERLLAGPIPLGEGIAYIDQVLAALSYAHQAGVIHRDIKPANMMLTPEGNIKLMDFGIAKAATDPHLTRTGTTVGSLFYISPEQLTGAGMDARSDLYSLGVAMYEIVTGKRPFEGKSEYSLMAAHLQETPRPPSEMNPSLPPDLSSVILMALAKNPGDRFQTADAFRHAVTEVAKGIAAPPGAAHKRTPPSISQASTLTVPRIAPPPGPQPGPEPELHARQESSRTGHRGIYMLLGALIAIAIIVTSAVELPRWFRAHARTAGAGNTVSPPSPSSPPPRTGANSSTAAQGLKANVLTAAPVNLQAPASTEGKGAGVPSKSGLRAVHVGRRIQRQPRPSPRGSSPGGANNQKPSETQPQPPSPAKHSGQDAAAKEAAALQSLEDRMDQLSGRATAVKASIGNLEQQVASTGQSLRPSVLASESRMERYMDEADSAISAHNAPTAKHYMDLAEREISNLETFLGR